MALRKQRKIVPQGQAAPVYREPSTLKKHGARISAAGEE